MELEAVIFWAYLHFKVLIIYSKLYVVWEIYRSEV
jgi:hypothetical protein